jgi:hypothetical protein
MPSATRVLFLFMSVPPDVAIISTRDRFANETETDVADAERGTEIVITIRDSEGVVRMWPAASTYNRQSDARRASPRRCKTCVRGRTRRIVYRRRGVIVRRVGVCSPFANIAEHVVEPPRVRLLASDGM